MIDIIPTDNTGLQSYVQTTTFEGTDFLLAFQYNQRCASWYLSVADNLGVDIYNGVKLVCGIPLLRKCKDPRRPAGAILCLSSTSDQSPPALYDLWAGSGRCQLLYMTSDWVTLITTQGLAGLAAIQATLTANTQTSSASLYGQE